MKQGNYRVLSNRLIARATWEMVLEGDTGSLKRPGQFVNVQVPGKFLRRPLSVAAWDNATLTLIYKVVGQGTDLLTRCRPADSLNLLCGLGNGFDLSPSGQHPLLVGGGVGLPPLYQLAMDLVKAGKQPHLIMGFGSSDEIFYEDLFRRLISVTVCTVDGSAGIKGFVTQAALPKGSDYFFACGPSPMLQALCSWLPFSGQLSLEERMGCGFGACMGCSIQTTLGSQRVCKEGPVFAKEVLIW